MARTIDCPVYQRERLDVGLTVAGPAILDQFDCTTVICPGQTARVDEWKNLIVTWNRPLSCPRSSCTSDRRACTQ